MSDAITIQPVANGFIVRPEAERGSAPVNDAIFVFGEYDKLFEYIEHKYGELYKIGERDE